VTFSKNSAQLLALFAQDDLGRARGALHLVAMLKTACP
jgi:hypothetical protein